MIFHSPHPAVTIPDVSITDYVLRNAARLKSKAALVDGVTGRTYSYAELAELAAAAPPFGTLLEPDDSRFLAPDDMTAAIADFCQRTRQSPPQDVGATVRC